VKKVLLISLTAIFLVSMFFVGTACRETEAITEPIVEETYTIGLLIWNMADQYAKWLTSSFENYVEESYPNVNLLVVDGMGTVEGSIRGMEDFVAQDVDLIILQPAFPDELVDPVKNAQSADIPVVCTNVTIAEDIVPFVVTDFYSEGLAIGEYLAKHAIENAKVLGIKGIPFYAFQDRWQGVTEKFLDVRDDIELLEAQFLDEPNREQAMKRMEDWVNVYPEFDVIVALSDEMALGAVEALRGTQHYDNIMVTDKKGTLIIVGNDASPQGCKAIKDEEYTASAWNDVPLMAKMTIDKAVAMLDGRDYKEKEYLPVDMVDINNVEEIIDVHKAFGNWDI